MKIDRPGRYRRRDGMTAYVMFLIGPNQAWGHSHGMLLCWNVETGVEDLQYQDRDLVEYLGPLEPGDDGFKPSTSGPPLPKVIIDDRPVMPDVTRDW